MEPNGLQQDFFNALKNLIPPHLSMADEMARLFDLSYDSVYRRIRGEKPLSMAELKILCDHFQLSLDQVLKIKSDAVVFNAPEIDQENKDFGLYLKTVLEQLKTFQKFPNSRILYLCKDFTLFQFFLFPAIGAFKSFFWMRDLMVDDRLKYATFSVSQFPEPEILSLGKEVARAYNKINSVEIVNLESINSSLGQIQYYREAGLFATEDDFQQTCKDLEDMVNHMQAMAERGVKFYPGESDLIPNGKYELYINELLIGNNTILVQLGEQMITFIPHAAFKYMTSRDPRFGNYTLRYFNHLINRSSLISNSGDKERSKYFNRLRSKIKVLRTSQLTVD